MADVMPPPPPAHQAQTPQDTKSSMASSTSPESVQRSNSVSNSASRRPPRKSTLTQQQKNQKRQRATQDQLMTLEVEFNKNPTPTALVRERIAQEINMTERSVQIWFQNRRAKIKNIAKRSIESGEDCDSIPESMRQYLAMQAYGPGKGLPANMLGRGPGFGHFGNGGLMLNHDQSSSKVVIQHFHCRSLSIGTWRRVGQSTMDLVIFYSPDKACVTYYINNDSAGYKIEYPFAWIKNITLKQGDVLAAAEGASQRSGGLIIELNRPPKFYMDSSGSGGFYECGDFTEDQQASQVMVHHLGGPSKVLSGQLAKLVSLEAYQNRHNIFDPNAFAVSAPVSPMGRPASQPNHMMHPHTGMHLFPPQDPHAGMMGPPGPRGHKRQRSRSVPAAIDFNMFRTGQMPMPSFLIQEENQPAHVPMQDPNIFAPVPQHQIPQGFAGGAGPQHLSIDTSQSYNSMGMQFNGSVSATTANSPSEFGTPGFFTQAPPAEALQPTQFNPHMNNGFLTVDSGHMLGTSTTPLSMTSHGDPVIADHSPPLNGMGRSQSADLFGTPNENAQLGSDDLYLSESFNKQIALPFRSPMAEDAFQSPMPDGMFNFQSPPSNSQDANMQMNGQQQMNYQSPPQHEGSNYQSPAAQHQDSGVSFSTPSHVPQDQAAMFHTPGDTGMLYNDAKMYTSPGQMQQVPDEQQMFQHQSPGNGFDMQNQQMFGFVDPNHLGQQQ
ncbi:hypothetical protein CKM354_000059200 [Cercospora kikuchii]|uniref:Homeobox domain-containing protein n=1 Tax=Cercospora kikuchii TaxID=84275 RepID=A0A9P3C456_9PEZI|nr:uncharacterized protein CKM354_000059200 [Cercospora kikuchii]GIZ37134.1 hypothetical protein CKM354_000059200 [Cercospora kikuchii]